MWKKTCGVQQSSLVRRCHKPPYLRRRAQSPLRWWCLKLFRHACRCRNWLSSSSSLLFTTPCPWPLPPPPLSSASRYCPFPRSASAATWLPTTPSSSRFVAACTGDGPAISFGWFLYMCYEKMTRRNEDKVGERMGFDCGSHLMRSSRVSSRIGRRY